MASEELFGRNYRLEVTNLATDETVIIDGLRITFKISKTKKDSGNRAVIEVFNISRENRGKILALNTKDGEPQTRCALYGGFGKDPKLLFNGTGLASTMWKPPNYVTTFTVTDESTSSLTTDIFEFSYNKGASIDKIVSDMLGVLGLPTGKVDTLGVSLKRSRSFSGPPTKLLRDLASTYGFRFDVQNGRASIIKKGSLEFEEAVVVLTKDTGLVGTPYWEGSIVKAQCLVIPEVVPNAIVNLGPEDDTLIGPYSVAKMEIRGDNWGGQALMELELEPRELKSIFDDLIGVGDLIASSNTGGTFA